MQYQIKINSVRTVEETSEYWTSEDYIFLLSEFNFPNAEKSDLQSLRELLFMAISDFEPHEAAQKILTYKLGDKLNDGQIVQISNDMLVDKISEEYPDISLHSTLFHINQLLYKAYNGKFPNTKATQIDCSISALDPENLSTFSKEKILKLLGLGLTDHNLIKRLFSEPMEENIPFPEAESILWDIETTDNKNFKIFTSDYWLKKEDFISDSFQSEFVALEHQN
ncbi:MAG: hypothetical protein H7329_18230 [Opitutaceae bacterium]|nr:hypothetical protein [Cytophagales bacterium]